MKRWPWTLLLTSICGLLLAVLMTSDGFNARLFGDLSSWLGAPEFWIRLADSTKIGSFAFEIDAFDLGWPLVTIGLAWTGGLSGLWMRLRWSLRTIRVLAGASLLYGGFGSLVAALALIGALMPSTVEWFESAERE